jgi:hypothetical protein
VKSRSRHVGFAIGWNSGLVERCLICIAFGEYSPIMQASIRLRRDCVLTIKVFLLVLSCSWLLLFLDSVHQRRRAELLLSDLELFPFDTAGFVEVRDFVNRHGGELIQQFPNLQFLPPGSPRAHWQGHSDIPLSYTTGPICTDRDCTFVIRISPYISRLALAFNFTYSRLGSALVHFGLRPWVVAAIFQVKDGKLWQSRAEASQTRHSRLLSYDGLSELDYEVRIGSFAYALDTHQNRGYVIGVPNMTGGRGIGDQFLVASLVQSSDASTRRAFDIHLNCLTVISRNCAGFRELAPSAWTDYQMSMDIFKRQK